jgi:hypothetical protein
MTNHDQTARELLAGYESVEGRIPPVLRDWLLGLLEGAHPDPRFDLLDLLREVR